MDHIVEMSSDDSVSRASSRSRGDGIGDNVMILENSSSKEKDIDDKKLDSSARKESLPSPQPQYRSYFQVPDNNQIAHELLLRPAEEKQSSIAFKPTIKYLKWTIPTPSGVKSTDYDIVLGISTENMNLDAVEAIVITVIHNNGDSPAGKSEVITSQELRQLCLSVGSDEATYSVPDDSCFRWKLHEKLILLAQSEEEKEEDKSTVIVMEVKTWPGELANYGSIELHYVEIISDLKELNKGDPMYREHKPFLHTADINRTGVPQLDETVDGPLRITDYTISGDGSCVLVRAVTADHQFLQLWSFQSQPGLVAWMQLRMVHKPAYDYCLSWNGSQLVCVDLSGLDGGSDKEQEKNATAFYKVDTCHTEAPDKAIAGSGLVSFTPDEKRCPTLRNLSAKAAFHIVETQKQNIRYELFVTCDGVTIEVYSTNGSWNHSRSIALGPTRNAPINVCNALRNNLRSCYLAMRDRDTHQVSTWDITRGIRLSSYTNLTYEQMKNVNDCAAVSQDGSRIAIPGKYKVDVFLTATWTRVVNYPFRGKEHPTLRSVQFIYNEQIMIELDYQHLPYYRQNHGFIHGVNRDLMVVEYINEGRDTFRMTFNTDDTPTSPRAICVGISQVSLFILEHRVLSPTRLKKRCSESCRSFPNEGVRAAHNSLPQVFLEPTAPSDLEFKAEYSSAPVDIHGQHEDLPVLVVTSTDRNDKRKLSISLPKGLEFKSATFVNEGSHLLISFKELVMVWSAPASPQDTFTLQLVHAVLHPTDWKVCSHRQIYGLRSDKTFTDVTDGMYLNDPIYCTEYDFLAGIAQLPSIFSNSNDVVQQEIIHYIGKSINNSHCDVVYHVCNEWAVDTHISTVQLWKAVLAHPIGRWIPQPDMVRETNPLLHLLNKTKDNLEAFRLAEVFIDYCVHQARLEKDPVFLLPVLQCLQELVNPKKPYSETALKLLRNLAYLPARDHEAIVSRHWIAHPFELRWRFWVPNPRGLDQFKDQVLHVTSAPTVNHPENSFSRKIYLASFDMLWLRFDGDQDLREMMEDGEEAVEDIITKGGISTVKAILQFGPDADASFIFDIFYIVVFFCGLICVLIYVAVFSILFIFYCLSKTCIAMMMRRFGMTLFPKVECHHFELEALDNPAIVALIEYKWNTIGLRYWLLRFLAQCVYHALVLVAIFMQIYRYSDESTMRSTFTAIVAMAGWFLWLELMQIIKYKHGYFRSVYNYVDLLAFLTPFVASLLQLNSSDFGAQNSLLSFSALFIFLHFLFEMRVIRSVCKFVSIIIHAISSIRVFFFIFAGGILAFAIAITHMLHKCTDAAACPSYTESFSFNLFRAVSATYFLMSGRYDPVSNGLSNDDVVIHVMLMMFFFFTVIVMMNVLIALINHAFDDGYKTWELDWLQNRMRFVEGAENMSYDFSGARDTFATLFFPLYGYDPSDHNYHSESIYYTATAFQVREYKKSTQNLKGEGFERVGFATDDTVKSQRTVSKIYGGHEQNWQQSQQQEQEEVDANTEDNKAKMELFDQILREQMEKLLEQQKAYKALLAAHEEQSREREELCKELTLLKGQQ